MKKQINDYLIKQKIIQTVLRLCKISQHRSKDKYLSRNLQLSKIFPNLIYRKIPAVPVKKFEIFVFLMNIRHNLSRIIRQELLGEITKIFFHSSKNKSLSFHNNFFERVSRIEKKWSCITISPILHFSRYKNDGTHQAEPYNEDNTEPSPDTRVILFH